MHFQHICISNELPDDIHVPLDTLHPIGRGKNRCMGWRLWGQEYNISTNIPLASLSHVAISNHKVDWVI